MTFQQNRHESIFLYFVLQVLRELALDDRLIPNQTSFF